MNLAGKWYRCLTVPYAQLISVLLDAKLADKNPPIPRIEVLAEKCRLSKERHPFSQHFPLFFVFSLEVPSLPALERAHVFSEMSVEEPFPRHRLKPRLSTGVLSLSCPKVPLVLCSVQPGTWKQVPEKYAGR